MRRDRAHSLHAMQRMLEVCCGHDHSINVLAIIKLFVVASFGDLVPDQSTQGRRSFIAATVPNV